MNIDEMKTVLWQLSINFIKSNNTMMGSYTYQDLIDDIYMASLRRHIIGDLQLFEANDVDGYTEAVFMFSPNYLNREDEMLFSGMGDIKWKILLPDSNENTESVDRNQISSDFEEEIVEKISCSRVEILYFKKERDINLKSFKESFLRS
jgi:hypothetical protein